MEKTVEIAVIGAGLTGMTTAFYLKKNNKDFIVLEEKDRPGGVIQTRHENGFTYEEGPNTGVIGNPDIAELFEDLNGLCKCEIASEKVKKRYILKDGVWEPMPMGPWQAVNTSLFTLKDKFRLLGEPFRSRGTNPDEPLSEMVKRRMGQSFLDYAIDPFILGVYAGDPSMLLTKYAFPKLYNLEQNYGSFIGGSIKKSFEKKDEREKKATRKVFSVYGGLSGLINALWKSAGEERFLFNTRNIEITPEEDHFVLTATQNNEKMKIRAGKVITTSGSYSLRQLLPFAENKLLLDLEKLRYARVMQVVVGFNKWDGMPLDGFGGLIPFREKRDILGVLFLSALLSQRAPEGGALCSVFVGGVRREDMADKTDDEIRRIVEREFCDIMRLKEFNPDLFKIIRYRHAIPQYGIESREKLDAIEKLQSSYKGLVIGGNLRDGIGMADRIKQGKHLADIV
ncbi:MAG: protoporphyrinogen oxidase [Bacteroidales bacterium]|nr:protoporphyrinogen oxidase [Bacteroidales bacterium]